MLSEIAWYDRRMRSIAIGCVLACACGSSETPGASGSGSGSASVASGSGSVTAGSGSAPTAGSGSAPAGSGTATAPAGSGSSTTNTGSGSATGSATESGSASEPTVRLELARGEKLHEPVVAVAWPVPGATATVTLVDVRGGHEVVVLANGKRHDVVATKRVCDKGAELWLAPQQRVVFRCESGANAEEWAIQWIGKKPQRYLHWSGARDQPEPAWAGLRPRAGAGSATPPKPPPTAGSGSGSAAPAGECCCLVPMDDQGHGPMAMEDRVRCVKEYEGRCVPAKNCAEPPAE